MDINVKRFDSSEGNVFKYVFTGEDFVVFVSCSFE